MKYCKRIALGTVAAIGLGISSANADENGFTSHHLVTEMPYEAYARKLPAEEKLELREYLNYEQREPCQFYQPIPQGFILEGCHLKHEVVQKIVRVSAPPMDPEEDLNVSNVLTDYEINFAFDSAAIEPVAGSTLDQIAHEIKKYNPSEVIVAGHADKAGPSSYNIGLSQKRANAVSMALNDRGVPNRVLDQEAYGESSPAVDTKDGVALRENRRVVVEFHK